MDAQVENWFRQLPHDEYTPNAVEEEALKEFLTGQMSAAVAAEKFTSAVGDAAALEEGTYRIFGFMLDAAVELPSLQGELIKLLAAIKQLPDPKWKSLPQFGSQLRDRWSYSELEPPRRGLTVERQRWANLNAFAARVVANQLDDIKHMAIWTLRDALEDELWNRRSPDGRMRPPAGMSIRILDGLVPGAAQWVLHAGNVIYRSQEDYGRSGSGGDLWKGSEGFSRARWNFWKSRFESIQRVQELDQATRQIAGKAVQAMDKVDG